MCVCVCCDNDVRNINRELILRVMGTSEVVILIREWCCLVLYWSCFRGVFLPRGSHGVFRVGASLTPKSGVLPTVATVSTSPPHWCWEAVPQSSATETWAQCPVPFPPKRRFLSCQKEPSIPYEDCSFLHLVMTSLSKQRHIYNPMSTRLILLY